jgi:ATP phosphoribosyltransferase regulatory subunit HisZ
MDEGIAGLETAFREVIASAGAMADFEAFLAVLAHDAAAARAALRVVLSRKGIGSQLIDNLNVSTHLRAVLTDLFLLDEAVKGLG